MTGRWAPATRVAAAAGVSRATIARWAEAGRIPGAVRSPSGRGWLFDKDAIADWVSTDFGRNSHADS
jgi:excisionase family DNA binding protein